CHGTPRGFSHDHSTVRLRVRSSDPEDVATLAPRLRCIDRQEIEAVSPLAPADALRAWCAHSRPANTIVDTHGEVVGMFGVVPDRDVERTRAGQIWLLGSDAIARAGTVVARAGVHWIQRFHADYRILWNHIDVRNESYVRCLLWWGFTIVRRVEAFGREGRPFYLFRRDAGE